MGSWNETTMSVGRRRRPRPFRTARRQQGWRRRALTVIELLAATALAVMLMASVLGVLESITRGQEKLLSRRPTEAWQARLVEQLEWDLTNSRSMQTTPEGLRLEGFAGRERASGTAIHCSASIQYVIVRDDEDTFLIRQEAHPDSLRLANTTAALVCIGIERIVTSLLDGTQASGADSGEPLTQDVPDGPIPDHLIIALYGADESTPVFQHAFTLR